MHDGGDLQPSFAARDVPYRSLPTMSKDILQAMMPEVKIYEADMREGRHVPHFT